MAGSDRYSLIVESSTRGEAELRRLTDSLNRISDVADRAGKRSTTAASQAGDSTRVLAASLRSAIQNPLAAAGQAVESFVLSAGKVGLIGGAVATAIGAIGVGAIKLVHDVGDAADAMQSLADRTGLSLAQVDRLQAGAKIAGINIESLASGTRALANFMGSFSKEGDEARKTLQQIGVSFFDASGGARDLGSVTDELLKRIGSIKNQQELVVTSTKLFGRGSIELLPLLKNYQDIDAEVRKLGFGTRTELLTSLARAGDEIDKLGLRWELVKGQLAKPAVAVVNIIASVVGALQGGEGTAPGTQRPYLGSPGQQAAAEAVRIAQGARAGFTAVDEQRAAQERARLAQQFTSGFSATTEGRQSRISEIQASSAEIRSKLASGNLDPSAFRQLQGDFRRLQAEQRSIEQTIQNLQEIEAALKRARESPRTGSLTPGLFQFVASDSPQVGIRQPSLRDNRVRLFSQPPELPAIPAERRFAGAGTFVAAGSNAPVDLFSVPAAGQARARSEGEQARQIRDREKLLNLTQQQLEFDARRIELTAGPGGEIPALQRIVDLRLASLDIQKQMGAEFDLQAEKLKVLQDADLRRLEIAKQQRTAFQDSVGRGFDAVLSGGAGGFRSFVASQGAGFLRTVATNAAGEAYSGVQGKFTLPGQRDQQGNLTLIGRLLNGTPVGDSGLKTATDLNTLATQQNTLALRTFQVGGGGGGGIAGITGIPAFGSFPGLHIPGLTGAPGGTSGFSGPVISSGIPGLGNIPAIQTPGFFGGGGGATGRGFTNQYGSGLTTGITYAAAIGAGAFGVISGIKQGGGRGALTAAASALGTAAALDPEPVSKAVLMIAAVAASFATQLLGDPKVKRGEEIDRLIEGSRFTEPTPFAFETDFYGRQYDTNIRGDFRPTIIVQAMDARSIIERSDDIADAVRIAMQSGHRVNRDMQQVVLAQ